MKRNILTQYLVGTTLYTICKPNKPPRVYINGSRHLGKSDSSVAKFTGRYNHA